MAKPRLVQYASYAPAQCCQFEEPLEKKGQKPKKVPGVMIFLEVSYRGNPGAPLTKIWGSDLRGYTRFSSDVKPDGQKASEHGSASFKFELCLPCAAFTREETGYTVRFELHAEDSDRETSQDVMGIYNGADYFDGLNCCPPVAPPPVRPMRKD